MVGNAVPTTVWSSATSMVTNEIPIIASSDSRNGRTCPLEWWAAVWTAIFVGATFDESNNFKILARRVIQAGDGQTRSDRQGERWNRFQSPRDHAVPGGSGRARAKHTGKPVADDEADGHARRAGRENDRPAAGFRDRQDQRRDSSRCASAEHRAAHARQAARRTPNPTSRATCCTSSRWQRPARRAAHSASRCRSSCR